MNHNSVFLYFISLFIIGALPVSLSAQPIQPMWAAEASCVADNREYFTPYQTDKTVLFSRLQANAGIRSDSIHSFQAGFVGHMDLGSPSWFDAGTPLLYYRGEGRRVRAAFGIFPRSLLPGVPFFLLSDSLEYFRPHVEGLAIELRGKHVSQHFWLDWTSAISEKRHETFFVGMSGTVQAGPFLCRNSFVYYHYAHAARRQPDEYLRDNGGAILEAGLRITPAGPLDSIVMTAGPAGSFDRIRNAQSRWHTAAGGIVQASCDIRYGGCTVLVSAGQGHLLLWGDSFYRAPLYARADLRWNIFSTQHASARFRLSLHHTPGRLDHSAAIFFTGRWGGSFDQFRK